MPNIIKHKFVSSWPLGRQVAAATDWNDEHALSGGVQGSVLIRDTSASDGAAWQTKGYFDVRDYGAKGDGVTDAAAAIDAAIDATEETNGGVLFFSHGIYRVGATLSLPVNRVVRFVGSGQALMEGSTPTFFGTVLRRASGFTDTMFTQAGTSSTLNRGAHFSHLSIAGDLQTGDAFQLDWLNPMQFDCVTFHRLAGHAIRARGLLNSWFRSCRWYGCGDATHEVVLLDGSTVGAVGSQGVHFIDCTWENNNGTDIRLTRENAPTTSGTTDIKIIGGKVEQSLSSPPGLPLCIVEATQHSHIQTIFANGQSNLATHLKVGGTTNTNILGLTVDSHFIVSPTTDALNPQYLVDILGDATGVVNNVVIRGHFRRGGGDGGAQIRIGTLTANKLSRITIDPANVYYGSLSNQVISGQHSGPDSISGDRGDATQTIVWGLDAQTQVWATALSANRTCHISENAEATTNSPPRGATFRIVRSGLGSFTLAIRNGFNGPIIKTLPVDVASYAEATYDGADWVLTAYGEL